MRWQRVRDVRSCMEEALVVAIRLNGRRAYDGRERQSSSQGLRQSQQVGFDAEVLESEIRAESAKGGLRLIENQQHAAPVAMLPDFLPIALRRHDNPAGTFHRLGNNRCKRAR